MKETKKQILKEKVISGYDNNFSSSFYGVSKIKRIILSGKFTTEDLNSALFIACERGNIEIVQLLVKSGANDLENALFHSINHPFIIKYLLDKGAKTNIVTKVYSHTKFVEADPDPIFGSMKPVAVYKDISLLELAVTKGNLESIRYIMASNKNILGLQKAIQIAVDQNNEEIVKIFIDTGIKFNYKYLLASSCQNENIDMLKLLIKSGANINENLSTVSCAYHYFPSSQEKELDTIFINAGVSCDVIREIKNGTHESIPIIYRKDFEEIANQIISRDISDTEFIYIAYMTLEQYNNLYCKKNADKFSKIKSYTSLVPKDGKESAINTYNEMLELAEDNKQIIEVSQEQREYNQRIIGIIEEQRKEQIDNILSSKPNKPKWISAISIFGVIPLDALEKSSGETKEFIMKLMFIVKEYFGNDEVRYNSYIEINKEFFEYWKESLVWFKRCQTFDKTLIPNQDEPIKYPLVESRNVLTKQKLPSK